MDLMTQSANAFEGTPDPALEGASYRHAGAMGASMVRALVGRDTASDLSSNSSWWVPFDHFVDTAKARDFEPYLTLTYKPYDWSGAPALAIPSVGEFAVYCRSVAQRFNGRVKNYSVWNEPNLFKLADATGTPRTLTSTEYGQLYRACYAEIHAVDSSAKVYFGELATGGRAACDFVAGATRQTIATITDGLAIHPYQTDIEPEQSYRDGQQNTVNCKGIGRLDDWNATAFSYGPSGMRRLLTPAGGRVPVMVTEFGYCTDRTQDCANPPADRSEATRAGWIGRAYRFAASKGVTVFSYYGLLKQPETEQWRQDYGIVNRDGTRTPSIDALRAATGTVDPTASIGAATNVTASAATVNGIVDPAGRRTTYHFEYGPTTAYGSSTPEQTVAANAGPTPVDAVLAALVPGRTYHFKLVVSNRAGSSSSSDASFSTPDPSRTATLRSADGRRTFVYFRARNGNLRETSWNGLAWDSTDLGVEMLGSPAAFEEGATRFVYFRGANGHLWQLNWTGSAWTRWDMGIEIAGSPALLDNGPGTTRFIYVRGANGHLLQIHYTGRDWDTWDMGLEIDGTPAAIPTYIYVRGANGHLWQVHYTGSDWTFWDMGFVSMGGNPAVLDASVSHQIYLRGSDGDLHQVAYNGREWTNWDMGVGMSGDPTVIDAQIFLRGSSGNLWQVAYTAGDWSFWEMGFAPAQGDPSGFGSFIYYRGPNGNLTQVNYTGTGWTVWDMGS